MRRHVFADEAGDFAFKRGQNSSRYFLVCVVVFDDCSIGNDLLSLRRELAWEDLPLGEYFHASADKQAVRDRVFAFLKNYDFKIYAQILEKSKAQPQVRTTSVRFYQHAWLYLLRHSMPLIVSSHDELMVTTDSIGQKKGQAVFSLAVEDVLNQTVRLPRDKWRTAFWPAASDPCIQIADYCTWAIQRKWEKGDSRSYDLIRERIVYEYDTWSHGKKHHY